MPPSRPYKRLVGKEAKTHEIKKALTHRARIRKNYFKLLEKEGYQPPEKPKSRHEADEAKDEAKEEADKANEDASDSQEDAATDKRQSESLKPKEAPKPMTYNDRRELIKQRKNEKRLRQLERVREQKQALESQEKLRQRHRARIDKRTRKGQPMMGPRINNLLDKIKKETK